MSLTGRELIEHAMDDFEAGEAWPDEAPPMGGATEASPITPPDVETCSGIMRRVKRLTRDRDEINAVVDAEIRRLEAFRADSIAGIERQIAWGERAVDAFMRQWAPSAHKKTLKLPHGTARLSAPRDKLIVTDEAAFADWAVGRTPSTRGFGDDKTDVEELVLYHPELVKITIKPVADPIKALIRAEVPDQHPDDPTVRQVVALPDGTVIPGVQIERPRNDTFTLTIGED